MNIKKRISALAMATMMIATTVPIGARAENYIQPTKRDPNVAQKCDGAILSTNVVNFRVVNGELVIDNTIGKEGQIIRGNPNRANPGADVAHKYKKNGDGSFDIYSCSNVKAADGAVKDSDTYGVIGAGQGAREASKDYKRLVNGKKSIDQDFWVNDDIHNTVLNGTRVTSLTKPQEKRGPMSSMDIPKDKVRQCAVTHVPKGEVNESSNMMKFADYLRSNKVDPAKLDEDLIVGRYVAFATTQKNWPNYEGLIRDAKNANPKELKKQLNAALAGKNNGIITHTIDVVISKNCPDDKGKKVPNKDPGKTPDIGTDLPMSSGPKDCLDNGTKTRIINQAEATNCQDNCSGGYYQGYVDITEIPGTVVGETILGQYRQDYRSTTKYRDFAYCPNQDNIGWKFWSEEPFNSNIGIQDQKDNYLQYMTGDKKDWTAMNKAWQTYFEERGIADYQHDDLRGKELASWLKNNGTYIMSGLPTYHKSPYSFQFEQINPGVNPPAKLPDSAISGIDHPGMSPLEHGWWQGYSNDGSNTWDKDKYDNDTERPIPIDVTEDGDVNSHLGKTIFTVQPLGPFKLAWIDRMRGYYEDGAPKWKTGSNITRRCQQEFKALVKYPREHYKNIIKNGWSKMEVYYARESWKCNAWNRWGDCISRCRQCRYDHVGTYTVDCYAYKSCQNKKPGDGVSRGAIQVTYNHPGTTWESADAQLAQFMRGDDRPGTNMIQHAQSEYPSVVFKYGVESCKIDHVVDAKYNPGRSWNYRDKVMTEYHGYLVPPTTPPGGTPDPRFPGIPQTPGEENPKTPGSGNNPPGNILIPFVGKDKGKPGSGGSSSSSTRNRDNYIKSGYGVTYEAGVKFFSDFGRDSSPRGDNIVAKFIGDKNNREPSQGSVLYRPRRTENIPINDNQAAFQRVRDSIIKNNPNVPVTTSRGLVRPTQSSARGRKELYIWDHAVRTRYNMERYIPYPNSVIEGNGNGSVYIPGIEGQGYAWKQKSGLGVTYGTDVGYFHADPSTKLYQHLIPGLDESRQHFIHLDYPNGVYSIGSIAQIGMFRGRDQVFKTKMGNYANIEVRGNMYEDSYTAPDNPYLNKEDIGGSSKKVNYNWNK